MCFWLVFVIGLRRPDGRLNPPSPLFKGGITARHKMHFAGKIRASSEYDGEIAILKNLGFYLHFLLCLAAGAPPDESDRGYDQVGR